MDDETLSKHLQIVDHAFRKQFESGDKLALLDCIRWCDSYGLQLPPWTRAVLSRAAGKYLTGVSANFHDAIFGARKDIGRHSNPAMRRRESHQLLFDVVTALRSAGFRGEILYERARQLLGQLELTHDRILKFTGKKPRRVPNEESIKNRFNGMQKEGARPSGLRHAIPLMIELGDPPRRVRK